MTCLNRVFSIKELEALDEKQLQILNDAIRHQALTSADVAKVLRQKVQPMYKRFVGAGRRGAKAAKRKRK